MRFVKYVSKYGKYLLIINIYLSLINKPPNYPWNGAFSLVAAEILPEVD